MEKLSVRRARLYDLLLTVSGSGQNYCRSVGLQSGYLYNFPMIRKTFGLSNAQRRFYEQYALENQVDLIELCILDILQSAGGKMTWIMLQDALPFSRTQLRRTAQALNAQDLVMMDSDRLWLSEYAPFVISDVLIDLHRKYKDMMGTEPRFEGEAGVFYA